MDLKNNYDEQREYLNKNLAQINTIVSAVLGVRTFLKIVESKTYNDKIHFDLVDENNYQRQCGIMAKAFKEIHLETFGVWWNEKGVTLNMHFRYEHIDGGSNGAHFCNLEVFNDFVKIL